MKLLVLSFYFAPDLCAGSFRATPLVEALRRRAPPNTQIDVITTLPNRYRSFSRDAPELESGPGVAVRRIALPPHRSDMLGQSLAFARYARLALRAVKGRNYDIIVATSSRLMTAALGAWIARRQRAALYLDIRDIFVDTIAEVLPRWAGWPAAVVFSGVERWTMRRADRINLVSRGFEDYFRKRHPGRPLSFFTNGVDDEFIGLAHGGNAARAPGPLRMVYAGNIGEGQALHTILPGVAKALAERARFLVIGDGGRRTQLEQALASAGVSNVELRAPMPRAELLRVYQDADVLFLHLGAQRAFEKVLPSKLFEYAALGKPILAGIAGYAARFVHEEIDNAAVFAPGDVAQAVREFAQLRIEDRPRAAFVARYARAGIADAMAIEILATTRGSDS